MAVYAIGDVQGCYDPLRRLLDAIRFEPDKDKLWFTGDLVNRGPKSLKTLRFVSSLGDSVVSVLGNHDLYLLGLFYGAIPRTERFRSLTKLLDAHDADGLVGWLRRRPLAHYDRDLNTLLVHAGTHPDWSVTKTTKRAAEVEAALQGKSMKALLRKMRGNTPLRWSPELKGFKRLRFIINCLTRMRMITRKFSLNFTHSGSPWQARSNLVPWFEVEDPAWAGTRIVFGHWSALGLIVLPHVVSLDTGCIWGRQLTAVRLDASTPRVIQVEGQY